MSHNVTHIGNTENLGGNLIQVDSTAKYTVGDRKKRFDKEYQYVSFGNGTFAAGTCVGDDADGEATAVLALDSGASSVNSFRGVCINAPTTGQFGWIITKGNVDVLKAAVTCAVGALMIHSSTAGAAGVMDIGVAPTAAVFGVWTATGTAGASQTIAGKLC